MTSLILLVGSVHIPWELWLHQSNSLFALDVCCTDVGELIVALNQKQSDVPLCHTLKTSQLTSHVAYGPTCYDFTLSTHLP